MISAQLHGDALKDVATALGKLENTLTTVELMVKSFGLPPVLVPEMPKEKLPIRKDVMVTTDHNKTPFVKYIYDMLNKNYQITPFILQDKLDRKTEISDKTVIVLKSAPTQPGMVSLVGIGQDEYWKKLSTQNDLIGILAYLDNLGKFTLDIDETINKIKEGAQKKGIILRDVFIFVYSLGEATILPLPLTFDTNNFPQTYSKTDQATRAINKNQEQLNALMQLLQPAAITEVKIPSIQPVKPIETKPAKEKKPVTPVEQKKPEVKKPAESKGAKKSIVVVRSESDLAKHFTEILKRYYTVTELGMSSAQNMSDQTIVFIGTAAGPRSWRTGPYSAMKKDESKKEEEAFTTNNNRLIAILITTGDVLKPDFYDVDINEFIRGREKDYQAKFFVFSGALTDKKVPLPVDFDRANYRNSYSTGSDTQEAVQKNQQQLDALRQSLQ
jgi:hypothetical protein